MPRDDVAGGRTTTRRTVRFRAWMKSRPDTRFQEIRRSWRAKAEALLQAIREKPATEAETLDAEQRRILTDWAQAAHLVVERLHDLLNDAANQVSECVVDPLDPESIKARAEFELGKLRLNRESELVAAKRAERGALRDFRQFRYRHRLVREPQRPADRLNGIAILLAVFIVEALLNVPFFIGPGKSLLDAGLEAVLVSAANISFGLVGGLVGVRFARHRWWSFRSLGGSTLCFSLSGSLTINVLMAQQRWTSSISNAVITANEGISSGRTIETAAAIFNTFDPWLMIVAFSAISAIAFFLAMFKGYQGFFEPYPGYGQVAKALTDARKSVDLLKTEYHAAVADALEKQQVEIEDELHQDREERERAKAIGNDAHGDIAEAKNLLTELRRSTEYLIQVYRDANSFVRVDPPPPKFDKMPDIDIQMPSAAAIDAAVNDIEERFEENEKAYLNGVNELDGLMRDFVDNFEHTLARVTRLAEGLLVDEGVVREDMADESEPAPEPDAEPGPGSDAEGDGEG